MALRFFNVYGTRQALSNPYTGVLAIFASRLLNGNPPLIFEDGLQQRDFVTSTDVARACRLALEVAAAAGQVFNIGSGRQYTVREIARAMGEVLGREHIAAGDHRQVPGRRHPPLLRRHHPGAAGARLRAADHRSSTGLRELASWLEGQVACDRVAEASAGAGRAGVDGMSRFNGKVTDKTVADHRRRRLHRHQPRRPPWPPRASRVRLLDNLSRPGVEQNLQWLRDTHGDRVSIEVARRPRRRRGAGGRWPGAEAVFHFAAQVAVTTSLVEPDPRLRGQRARHAERPRSRPRPEASRRSCSSPRPTRSTAAWRTSRFQRRGQRYEPVDAEVRARGFAEERPLDFHSPYGCSKGAADQYVLDYARSYGLRTAVFRMSCIYGPHQFGTEDQGWVAHFLIQALQGRADHALRRRHAGARHPLSSTTWCDAFLPGLGRTSTSSSGQAFNIGGGPANTVSACSS